MKKRIEYIDAARGLAIFTVVYSHICLFCLPGYESSSVIDFLRTYFLNAFFLISGIFTYRNRIESRAFLRLLWKRVYQLLIPTVIIGLTYALSQDISPASFFFNEAKYGYWFTISLFEMFVIYYVFIVFSCRFVRSGISSAIFMVISLLAYFFFKTHPIDYNLNGLLCWSNTMNYIPFFAFGTLIQANKTLLINIMCRAGGVICFSDSLFW